jgi:hypothetical protein
MFRRDSAHSSNFCHRSSFASQFLAPGAMAPTSSHEGALVGLPGAPRCGTPVAA